MAVEARRTPYLLIAPLTLFLAALLGLPLAVDIIYALSHVTFETLRSPHFIGPGNFLTIIQDGSFWSAMAFSLRFAVLATVAEVLLALALALFLAPLLARAPWLMAILMLPMMLAPALVGLMYRLLLDEFAGVVPYYLQMFTGDSPAFLDAANAFRTLVMIEVLQWTPFAILILYSAYRMIPADLHEAGRLDGAGAMGLLWYVDLPMMLPTIALTAFFRFIDSFRVFDNVYVLTGSGVGGSTTTISIFIYEAFFRRNDIGVAVAGSVVLLVLSGVVLALVMRGAGARQ